MKAYFNYLDYVHAEFVFSKKAFEKFWSVKNPEVSAQFDRFTDEQLFMLCDKYGDSFVPDDREDAIVILMCIMEEDMELCEMAA